jgi:hypothetical protein
MPITPKHRSAESRFRELLASADAPPPDAVEYEPDSVLFLWHDAKLAVFVDLATGAPEPVPAHRRAAYDQAACPTRGHAGSG